MPISQLQLHLAGAGGGAGGGPPQAEVVEVIRQLQPLVQPLHPLLQMVPLYPLLQMEPQHQPLKVLPLHQQLPQSNVVVE